MKTIVLSLCCTLTALAADDRLYEHKPTLADTMLATRAKYVAWLAEQTPARAVVSCEPWSVAGGKRPGWKDGVLIAIGDDPSKKSATLTRTLTAKKAVTLTFGFGGGDKIEVRLNDKPVTTLDTKLGVKRYGTSMRVEGDRRNQVLLDLPLAAGENHAWDGRTLWLNVTLTRDTSLRLAFRDQTAH